VCEQQTREHDRLTETELLRLWERAWRDAERRCARSLASLRRGAGGFYGADDFYQDLFCEFWQLVRCWRADGGDEAALWDAWRRILWQGGMRVLRRCPQRLWHGVERPLPPARLARDATNDDGGADGHEGLIPAEALVEAEDPQAVHDRLARVDALEEALWRLRPVQRQIVYMRLLRGLPEEVVARRLGLPQGGRVSRRARRGRHALRRHLARLARQMRPAKEEGER
jgi:RNA polymerase sigma factor (sigma-70 family)